LPIGKTQSPHFKDALGLRPVYTRPNELQNAARPRQDAPRSILPLCKTFLLFILSWGEFFLSGFIHKPQPKGDA